MWHLQCGRRRERKPYQSLAAHDQTLLLLWVQNGFPGDNPLLAKISWVGRSSKDRGSERREGGVRKERQRGI